MFTTYIKPPQGANLRLHRPDCLAVRSGCKHHSQPPPPPPPYPPTLKTWIHQYSSNSHSSIHHLHGYLPTWLGGWRASWLPGCQTLTCWLSIFYVGWALTHASVNISVWWIFTLSVHQLTHSKLMVSFGMAFVLVNLLEATQVLAFWSINELVCGEVVAY